MFASKANDVLRIKKLNTLFISYDGMTDSLGQSQVIPYLIGLSKNGFAISIISCEKETAFKKNEALISKLLQANFIDWHPLIYTKQPPVLSTLWDIKKIRAKVIELHRAKNFVLVHCRSYITSLVGVAFCKKNSIPFVFDMRGFWADERVEGKIWNLKNPLFALIYNFFKRKEIDFVNHAAAIVSLTHAGKREIQSWKIDSEKRDRIYVIPCSADFELFQIKSKEQKHEARKRIGLLDTDFVLTYLGSLGTCYLLGEMLDFFLILKNYIPESKFYFITNDNPQLIRSKAVEKGILESDIIIESAQRNEVHEKLAASDWGISFIQPSFSKTASSPTKMGEMLAMGIPLVVNNKVGDVEEICKQTQGGVCLSQFSNPEYVTIVKRIIEKKVYDADAVRKDSYAIYGLEHAIRTYTTIYQNCVVKS